MSDGLAKARVTLSLLKGCTDHKQPAAFQISQADGSGQKLFSREPRSVPHQAFARLATRPAHRAARAKYRPQRPECAQERQNVTQTAEDGFR